MSIKKNTLWNFTGSILPLILGVFAIRFIIEGLGKEYFGVLTLIWALIGYFSLFDFGVGRALTFQVSTSLSQGTNSSKLSEIINSGILITCITGFIGGGALLMGAKILSHSWLNISNSLQYEVYKCLLIASLGIPLTTLTSGVKGVLEAFEDFKVLNYLRLILGFLNFLIPLFVVLFIGDNLIYIVVGLVLLRFVIFYLHCILLKRKLPEFKFSLKLDSSILKVLIGFGVWMTISNLISPLMIVSDRFVISNLLGAVVISFYTVPFEIVSRILVFPAALTNVLFPRFSHLSNCGKSELNRIYRKSYLTVALSMFLICLPIIIFSKFGLQVWLGSEYSEKSWLVASILSIGIFFNGIAMVPFAFVQSQGSSKVTAFFHIIELVIYFPILIVLTKKFNLEGAAFAWTFRVLIDLLILTFYARKILKSA